MYDDNQINLKSYETNKYSICLKKTYVNTNSLNTGINEVD